MEASLNAMQDARLKELEKFKQDYELAWGALSPEEVAALARTEKKLQLEHNPVEFIKQVHDAVLSRNAIEVIRTKHALEMEKMAQKVSEAAASVPELKAEMASLQSRLMKEQHQATAQAQKVDVLEQELAVCRYQLKMMNMQWLDTGKKLSHAQQMIASLRMENETAKMGGLSLTPPAMRKRTKSQAGASE